MLLSSCDDTSRLPIDVQKQLARMNARDSAMSPAGKKHFKRLYSHGDALNAFLSNTTVRSYDQRHGTQLEFLMADGRTYLWYPGNKTLLSGYWQIKSTFDGPDMCFRYEEDTYNPVTQRRGGGWECGDASLYLLKVDEVVDGDPMRLSSGRLPFVLNKEQKSIGSLAERSGHPGTYPNKVDW